MREATQSELRDEVFCIGYETSLLGGQMAGLGLERWIPGFTPISVHKEHIQRYEFACQQAHNKHVLDIACGTGRGSWMLGELGDACHVTACDIDEQTVRYAKLRNRHDRVSYQICDAQSLKFDMEFDLAISFETIEHVQNPLGFLAGIARALKPGGRLLISTPVSKQRVDQKPINPYHIQEWSILAFRTLLESSFEIQATYLQFRPAWHPSLWNRIASKLRGSALTSPYSNDSPPLWLELVDQPMPVFGVAYQIADCLVK